MLPFVLLFVPIVYCKTKPFDLGICGGLDVVVVGVGGGRNFKIIPTSCPSISLLELLFRKGVGSLLLCEY